MKEYKEVRPTRIMDSIDGDIIVTEQWYNRRHGWDCPDSRVQISRKEYHQGGIQIEFARISPDRSRWIQGAVTFSRDELYLLEEFIADAKRASS